MGTSLSGLLPQDTYQGLIKVGDNTAITSTLKTLSDGAGNNLPMQASTTAINFTGTTTGLASGVSGAIQFSNGSAFASDAANLFWDDTNNRLGVGTNAPTATTHIKGSGNTSSTSSLLIQNLAGTELLRIRDDGFMLLGETVTYGKSFIASANLSFGGLLFGNNFYSQSDGSTYIGAQTAPSAKLQIKGSGSTSATTSLLVQNSAGTEAFRVRDDLRVLANAGFNVSKDGYTGFISDGIFNAFGYQTAIQNDVVVRITFGTGTSVNTLLKVDNTLNSTGAGATTKPLVILANASQTANLLELQNSSGIAQSAFTANGNLVVGASSINASAILQADSTTKGFLPPRMTTTQKNAIASPAAGLVVYDSTTNKLQCYNGSTWNDLF